MIDRRSFALLSVCAAFTLAAGAAEAKPFDPDGFKAAQAAGKPVLIEVSAPWCPVCKAQKPILAELAARPKFKNLATFEIDFDSQKDVLRTLGVQKQSTLIVYKGAREVGRSTGVTDPRAIEDLLNKSL